MHYVNTDNPTLLKSFDQRVIYIGVAKNIQFWPEAILPYFYVWGIPKPCFVRNV